jgi:hypothetical protein
MSDVLKSDGNSKVLPLSYLSKHKIINPNRTSLVSGIRIALHSSINNVRG